MVLNCLGVAVVPRLVVLIEENDVEGLVQKVIGLKNQTKKRVRHEEIKNGM